MSLVRDAIKGARYQPAPAEKVVRSRVVKADARALATSLIATAGPQKISSGAVDLAVVAARANATFAPRATLTPDDIAAALLEQGISFQPALGPGTPLNPYSGYGERPRSWPYTPGTNISTQTRTGRIPFQTLTAIVEGYDIAQICISHIIADLCSMPLLFRAIEGYEGDVSKEIAQAKQFWKKPDGKHPWRVWLTKLAYQQLAYDCAMVYKVKTVGGKLEKVQVPDGRMFAPIVDYLGERPDAPAPSVIQFVEGIPWGWQDETMVIYEPFTARAEDPRYGLAPIECILLNANCFSADTEVLTQRGWLTFPEVDIATDEIATRNPKTQAFEWQQATKYYEAPATDPMYHFTAKSVDMVVTAGHRMLVDRRPKNCPSAEKWGDGWRIQAEELAAVPYSAGVRMLITSEWDAPDLERFQLTPDHPNKKGFTEFDGDDFAAFMGMYLAEGWAEYVPSRRGLVWISQLPSSKGFAEYSDLLERVLGRPCKHDGGRFIFCNSAVASYLKQFGKAIEKYIPPEVLGMSRRQLEIFWHFYFLGDGTDKGSVPWISTSSKRMADGLQEVAQKIGMAASVRQLPPTPDRTYKGRVIHENARRWQVTLSASKTRRFRVEQVPYEGTVYCVSVPNRVIYVRRNGHALWCGQTDVRFQWHFLQMFTGGQIPEGFAEAPPDQSDPDALEIWQELWDNYMFGDQSARYGMRWVPAGTKFTPYKPQNFDEKFPAYLMRRTVSMFHRTPQDLGILDDVNRATSETQVDQQFRISTRPRNGFIEDVFLNPITQEDLGLPIECFFDTGEEKEDRLMVAQEQKILVDAGIISPDEPREKIYGYSVDPENRLPRTINAGSRLGIVPLHYIEAISGGKGGYDLTTGAPFLDKIKPIEYIVPGSVTPAPNLPNGKEPPALGPGGQPGGQNKPPNPPTSSPTSTGAKPSSGQEPAHDEMSVESASAQPKPPTTRAKKAAIEAAGLAVRALDTGRILMMQRADDSDNAPGTFEFPGGTNDDDDGDEDKTPEDTARREWAEEVGVPVPAGKISGTWKSDNYQGFILDIERETDLVLNPKKIDKDEVQQVQWVSPANAQALPNLRPELKKTWPKQLEPGVEKDLGAVGPTTGITAATGLNGVVLTGFDEDEDEEDEEAVKAVLDQWQTHAMISVRRGRPVRYFADPILPIELARSVYKALQGVKTRADVRAVFKAVKANPKALRWQGHQLRDSIPKQYAKKLSDALTNSTSGIDQAVASTVTAASKASATNPDLAAARASAMAAVAANVKIDPKAMSDALAQLYADAYSAGTAVARNAVGVDALVPQWLDQPGGETLAMVSRDWNQWEPGWGAAALKDADGGLKTLLDARDITIKGISDSAMTRLGNTLADGIAAGDAPATIARSMSDMIADPQRAFTIADTETARSMVSASIDTYDANGVEQVDLLTFDPCPECEELEGDNPYDLSDAPDVPIHPQCFPAGTITAGPRIVGSVVRWYDGELVKIVTSSGEQLSVTPNHPILTDEGWVAAGLLDMGSNVIRCIDVERVVAIRPDDHHGPALIEDVAKTLGGALSVVSRSVPVAAVDFHGDGSGSDVCVVRTDGLLRNDAIHAAITKPLDHREFELASHVADTFDAERLGGQASIGELRPSDCIVGSLSPSASLLWSGTGHAEVHGLGPSAGHNPSAGESATDAVAVDIEGTRQREFALAGKIATHEGGGVQVSELRSSLETVSCEYSVDARLTDTDDGRNLISGLAGLVESDCIIDLRRVKWSGHVYNLETENGWYMANSLIVHNCRCALAPANIPGT